MNTSLPGAVFDCMVFLQALANRNGPAFACKQLLDDGRCMLHLSPAVLAEVQDVFSRPKVRRKLTTLTDEAAEAFLRDVTAKAIPISEVPAAYSFPRDPKDEPILNLALAAGAAYLVTWDNDLLDLMNEALPAGKDFRQRFPGLTILTPVAFLKVFATREGPGPQAPQSPA